MRTVLALAFATSLALGFVAISSARAEAEEAKKRAWTAETDAARAASAALRAEQQMHELGARLDDLERLTIELQDGVRPDAYKRGFPEPGE
jgi:hypothetical protein